ncbi:sialate O-acetylesterase [Thalassomonas sp. M1454]|uniref:sialate O-acetylesterase n=1 Tax=Thalassomonas sp. M1454 TaxID=2594477 RepID=UPI00117D8ED1|nr:sialate O-acetylesterase [Thalassomonas sp. M1454]TRX53865.1 sialate O-acetylesterase [Thalassomonas sp. M1454]
MNKTIITTLTCAALTSFSAFAKVKPANLFTDNMVIQQQTDAAIWGWAEPSEKVTISASWGDSVTVSADKTGKWQTTLTTPVANNNKATPYSIEFKASNTVTINNVLVGEVWLASGQSNMAFTIKALKLSKQQIGETNFPHIREFTVQKNASKSLAQDVTGNWTVANETSVANFSATAYFFAREIHHKLGVPVGIVNSSWGGTPIESWLSASAQSEHEATQKLIAQQDKWAANYNEKKQQDKYQQKLAKWKNDRNAAKTAGQKFKQRRPKQPQHPHTTQRYPSNLYNGMINPLKPYAIKGVLWYQGEANSKSVAKGNFYQTQLTSLINGYRFDWNKSDLPFYAVQLANFKKPQVNPVETEQYWPNTRESMRRATKALNNADIAVAIDIGDANDIHPKNKMELGRRLSLLALKNEYNQDVVSSGPSYQSAEVMDSKIKLKFSDVGSGLTTDDGKPLTGFAIAGSDGNYVWAEAKILPGIKGKQQFVEVSHPEISKPVAVKYGWADNPSTINLYNKEGLPASPFSSN